MTGESGERRAQSLQKLSGQGWWQASYCAIGSSPSLRVWGRMPSTRGRTIPSSTADSSARACKASKRFTAASLGRRGGDGHRLRGDAGGPWATRWPSPTAPAS